MQRVRGEQAGTTPPSKTALVLAVAATLAAVALLLAVALHSLAVDDAFITFRYARNLASGQGFAYNPGRLVLSTTAPLWALILAGGAFLWPPIPALANALGAAALGAGAMLLFVLGRREGEGVAAALAALLFVLHPLLWLSLGLETPLFLALGLAALLAYRAGRLWPAAILVALATLTRGDGLVLAGLLAGLLALRVRHPRPPAGDRPAWRDLGLAALAGLAVLLPLWLWLTWHFGSPLPATLAAKRAQVELGVTGFYTGTTYLQGLALLLQARLAQSPAYLLFLPALAIGLVTLPGRGRWAALPLAWSGVHLVGYTLLGVAPYSWYYAPLLPGPVCLAAAGVVESGRRLAGRVRRPNVGRRLAVGLTALWSVALLGALAWSDLALVRALDGPVPPPEDPVSKVLPEAKGRVYEQAGRWLAANTPPGALVGVTEVGILGYYSRRPMVDFLGLLEPDVADAVGRGDLYWALLHYQPDYLALTAVSPLYAYDLRADPWFQAAYAPVQTFEDVGFWGSPLTVYERRIARQALAETSDGGLPAAALRLDVDLGPVRLLGAVPGPGTVRPGQVLPVTLYWQARQPVNRDYTVFVHLLGRHDRVIAQRDAAPGLGALPTSRWQPGQVVADPYLLVVPEAAYTPDEAVWEVGLYEAATGRRLATAGGRDNVRFGAIQLEPTGRPLYLDFGRVVLTAYELDRLALRPGEPLRVTLRWMGSGPAAASVQLLNEAGEAISVPGTQGHGGSDGFPEESFTLELPAGASPGAYDLQVVVTDPGTGQVLPLLGADGQPRGDRALLTKIRLYP